MLFKKQVALSIFAFGAAVGILLPKYAHANGHAFSEDGQTAGGDATSGGTDKKERMVGNSFQMKEFELPSFGNSMAITTILSSCAVKTSTIYSEVDAEQTRVSSLNPRNRTFRDTDYKSNDKFCRQIMFEAGVRAKTFGNTLKSCLIANYEGQAKKTVEIFKDTSEFCKRIQKYAENSKRTFQLKMSDLLKDDKFAEELHNSGERIYTYGIKVRPYGEHYLRSLPDRNKKKIKNIRDSDSLNPELVDQ